MMNYFRNFLLSAVVCLSACSHSMNIVSLDEKPLSVSQQPAVYLSDGDFAHIASAEQFVVDMARKHHFDSRQLLDILSQAKKLDNVIQLMNQQAPVSSKLPQQPNGAWIRYHKKFITQDNVQRGVQFWNQYQQALIQAQNVYGVPPEIIVGIIGVETGWGRITGKTRVIDALATLAFAYPRRASYFTKELETFLLMSRQEGTDPLTPKGSFAGAMGYGQFMPSSYQQYAVDFDYDGHTNLWSPVDVIGSVAHYFQQHGWQPGQSVAVRATGQSKTLNTGFNTRYTPAVLEKAGFKPDQSVDGYSEISLLQLDMGNHYQYWYGLPNFYVITRYNHSTYYAMAVWQLGMEIKKARDQHSISP